MDRNDRLVGFLGLCRRAGVVTPGFDAAMEKVKAGAAQLVLLAEDCSPKTKKEAEYFCGRRVPVLTLPVEMDSMVHIFKKRVAVLAVSDTNFAAKLRTLLQQQ